MCSFDDGETWEIGHTTNPVARKAHTCGDCGRRIEPGERYHRAEGVYDRTWMTAKACDHCWVAADWLRDVCGGWLWDGVLDDLSDHLREYGRGDSPRSSHLTRLVRLGHRRWTRRDGTLVPLEDVRATVAAAIAAVPVEMRGAA